MALGVNLNSRLLGFSIFLLILARSLLGFLRRGCGLISGLLNRLVIVLIHWRSDCRRAHSRTLEWSWRGVRHLHNVAIAVLQSVKSKHTAG
jgi:hypothetical protein